MNRSFYRKVIVVAILVASVGGIYLYREFTRVTGPMQTLQPDFTVNANELLQQLANDTALFTEYHGKVLEVAGPVKGIDTTGSAVLVFLGIQNSSQSVRCLMNRINANEIPRINERVTVRGHCTGYEIDPLLGDDLILNDCVLITKP